MTDRKLNPDNVTIGENIRFWPRQRTIGIAGWVCMGGEARWLPDASSSGCSRGVRTNEKNLNQTFEIDVQKRKRLFIP
jgi:hypothetical protein